MEKKEMTDVVVSSRIRFARNLAEYPFRSKMDKTSASEIINKIGLALGDGYKKIDLTESDEITSGALVEDHSISREFASEPLPHALFFSDDGIVKVMVCEEDHIRLQAICRGLDLDTAFERASETEAKLSDKLNFAFSEKLGYLTHCPTNLGIAMRASVMAFLPALTSEHKIKPLIGELSKIGLTIRGIYGEGSEALGCLYQISNSETLGVTEEGVISKLNDVIERVAELERKARTLIKESRENVLKDKVMRSLGTLKYSFMLDTAEFMRCYSNVRLGVSLGILEGISYDTLDSAFTDVMPYTLMKRCGKKLDEQERDLARAARVKELL